MKFSEQWLREWVNPGVSTAELVEQLTMAGLEVDGVESAAGDFSGVVVGEIIDIAQHPDADKLRVCQVKSDEHTVQVVCGAPNAAQGLKIPFAKVGAVLPENFKIKKAKLRGVESFGMLCGASELGLEEGESDGLYELPQDAPVGADLRDYLNLNDSVIEVDLTPNRGDCLGMIGLAREVAVLNKLDLTEPAIAAVPAAIDDSFSISIDAPEDCPRYLGRIIRGIDISRPTPNWMVERLRRGGIRSIDAVVDITNYVLLELGQPQHAFDLNTLKDGIVVRKAKPEETLTLLDGQELKLNEESLVIADHEKALALAGIMGGEMSGCSPDTKDVFLETAYFSPEKIAGRARSYGLHTDSSHRFERGVDFRLQEKAAERATQLLLEICGGEAGPLTVVESTEHLPQKDVINLREKQITRTLGFQLPADEVTDILSRLGLQSEASEAGWLVDVPSYRFDIAIEADLLEELARIYGYNNLPVSKLGGRLAIAAKSEGSATSELRGVLVARGYQEAITYSFVEPKLQQLIDPQIEPVALQNPISADMAVMRTSLWSGLLTTLQYNLNRQQNRARLFEIGQVFLPSGGELAQTFKIGGLLCGERFAKSWINGSDKFDFYDIKGDVEALFGDAIKEIGFQKGEHSALHPGQTAEVIKDGQKIGYIGALHPQLQQSLDISQAVYLFELDFDAVAKRNLPKFKELSKFPEVRRDLAIIINQDIPSADLMACIRENAGDYLIDLVLFDVYQGKGIDSKRKSVAVGLTFQHQSRTLNEDEINKTVEKVVASLQQTFDASLRT